MMRRPISVAQLESILVQLDFLFQTAYQDDDECKNPNLRQASFAKLPVDLLDKLPGSNGSRMFVSSDKVTIGTVQVI